MDFPAFGRGRFLWVLTGLAGLLILPGQAEEKRAGAGEKLFVIGASASAGFIQAEIMGGLRTTEFRLKYYLDAALSAPHQPVDSATSSMLVVEVSVSSEAIDREMASAYAAGGVGEYWLVLAKSGKVECYSNPSSGVYQTMQVAGAGLLNSVVLPGVSVDLGKVFLAG